MFKRIAFVFLLPVLALAFGPAATVFTATNGTVKFVSKAPLETIKAESARLGGVIDISKKTFAFTVPFKTFEGFNDPLQKEHFNENYVESDKFPNATFKGKIIEDVDLSATGTYQVRTKGILSIHGKDKEMIIKSTMVVKEGQIAIDSDFNITLEDHNIKIPNIVSQKIAKVIAVTVKMTMMAKK